MIYPMICFPGAAESSLKGPSTETLGVAEAKNRRM